MAGTGETLPYANNFALGTAEMARIRRDIPTPPAGFNARVASEADLAAYRLPARPDPVVAPRLRALWDRAFAQRRAYVAPELRLRSAMLHPMLSAQGGGLSDGAGAFGGRWGSSRNWSGAVIAARDGMVFQRVAADWRVPQAAMPADAQTVLNTPGGLPGGSWKASMWIGLDGYRRSSMSLPQIGTTCDVTSGGVLRCYLWVQWWVRDKFFGEVEVQSFQVNAGDEIIAFMDVVKPDDVGFNITNVTTGQHVTIAWVSGEILDQPGNTPAGKLPQPPGSVNRRLTPVEGRHAVWCVERPSVMPTDAQIKAGIRPDQIRKYRLPALPGAGFSGAAALMRGAGGAMERDLTAARQLRMLMARGDDVVALCGPEAPATGGDKLVVEPA